MAISNKKLLVAKGIATRSKDATRGSWPYYCIAASIKGIAISNKKLLVAKGIPTRSKDDTRGSGSWPY